MPIYAYSCKECGNEVEKILSIKDRNKFKEDNVCSLCGGDFQNKMTMPSKTPGLWGDQTGTYGANGFFSPSLGRHVTSKHEEEKIAQKMGYVNTKDIESKIERKISAKIEEDAHFDKLNDAYQARVKKDSSYGSAIRAVEELLPAHEMLEQANNLEKQNG